MSPAVVKARSGLGFIADSSATVSSGDADCTDPTEASASAPDGDCDDLDPTVHPDATEAIGDEVDSDCDGIELCYADTDADRYGAGADHTVASDDADCDDPGELDAGAPLTDCDDADPSVNPGAPEVCDADATDEDCNGLADDADPSVDPDTLGAWAADADGYGYGDPATVVFACVQPTATVPAPDAPDCDDANPSVFPGATELEGDGIDQDCDGADALADTPDGDAPVGDGEADASGDGKGGCSTASAPLSLIWALPGVVLVGRRRRTPRRL